jgi:hypothetical protein
VIWSGARGRVRRPPARMLTCARALAGALTQERKRADACAIRARTQTRMHANAHARKCMHTSCKVCRKRIQARATPAKGHNTLALAGIHWQERARAGTRTRTRETWAQGAHTSCAGPLLQHATKKAHSKIITKLRYCHEAGRHKRFNPAARGRKDRFAQSSRASIRDKHERRGPAVARRVAPEPNRAHRFPLFSCPVIVERVVCPRRSRLPRPLQTMLRALRQRRRRPLRSLRRGGGLPTGPRLLAPCSGGGRGVSDAFGSPTTPPPPLRVGGCGEEGGLRGPGPWQPAMRRQDLQVGPAVGFGQSFGPARDPPSNTAATSCSQAQPAAQSSSAPNSDFASTVLAPSFLRLLLERQGIGRRGRRGCGGAAPTRGAAPAMTARAGSRCMVSRSQVRPFQMSRIALSTPGRRASDDARAEVESAVGADKGPGMEAVWLSSLIW